MQQTSNLIILLLAIYAFVAPDQAFAYLEPGTGSMLLQLLFGGVAGILVIMKLYWSRFVNFFRNRRSQKDNPPPFNKSHE